jgi:hypothetical protein
VVQPVLRSVGDPTLFCFISCASFYSLSNILKSRQVFQSTWKYLVAGAIAGAVSRTVTAPLDRLKVFFSSPRDCSLLILLVRNKTPLQSLASGNSVSSQVLLQLRGAGIGTGVLPVDRRLGIGEAFKLMLQEGGLKGCWRGNGVNVLKVIGLLALEDAHLF